VSLRGQVLIGEQTYQRCADFVTVGEPMDVYVKGKSHPVSLREVLGIPSLGKVLPRQEMRRSPRVEVKLPFAYHAIDNEVVSAELRQAVTVDVGYYGLLVEAPGEMVPHSEIKLDLPLPSIDYTARDVYAKVVKTLQRDGRMLAALEFSSLSDRDAASIRRFLQLQLQGG